MIAAAVLGMGAMAIAGALGGGQSAMNSLNKTTDISTKILNDTRQSCTDIVTQENIARFECACSHCTCNFGTLHQSNSAVLDVNCSLKAINTSELETQLKAVYDQVAKTVGQNINLDPEKLDSENQIVLRTNISNVIENVTKQTVWVTRSK